LCFASLNPERQVAAAAERARTRVAAGGWTPEVQKFYREVMDVARVSCILFTVTFYANHAHSLTRSP
jgi:hypothetical protein